jgi:hypothetical protein
MYPIYDPTLMLELHHQRAAELHREAALYRLAREARKARRHGRHRWARASAQPRPASAPNSAPVMP